MFNIKRFHLNKKGGVPEVFIDVIAYSIWLLVILGFILLFALRAYFAGEETTDGGKFLVGSLDPKIKYTDSISTFLAGSVKYCSANKEQLDITPVELMNLFMKGKPVMNVNKVQFSDPKYENYFIIWRDCFDDYLFNLGYKNFKGFYEYFAYRIEGQDGTVIYSDKNIDSSNYDYFYLLPSQEKDIVLKVKLGPTAEDEAEQERVLSEISQRVTNPQAVIGQPGAGSTIPSGVTVPGANMPSIAPVGTSLP